MLPALSLTQQILALHEGAVVGPDFHKNWLVFVLPVTAVRFSYMFFLFLRYMYHIQPKQFPCSSIQHHKNTIIHLLQSPSTTAQQLNQIHAQLLQHPSSFSSLFLCNSLIFAYATSSTPTHAFSIFATQMGHLHPNHLTIQFLLKASSKSKSTLQTTQLHSMTLKLGFGSYTFVQNAILHCYALGGQLSDARRMFDEMPHRDVVSFNSMIHSYCESGEMDAALQVFGWTPAPNVISWTAMVVGYSSNGDVAAARQFFDQMPNRDLVSWNAMISGYVQNCHPVEALSLFCRMQAENFKPNRITVASVLSACAAVGALDTGKWIHVFLNKNHFRLDPILGTALIDMYSKCGVVELALDVFESLQQRNSCTWNAMINGMAMNGHAEQALDLFSKMQVDRSVRPDEVTFVGLLLACSHGGFLEEGKRHFYCTLREYGINPLVEHYGCIVDLLGRYGLLKEAEQIIRSMPIAPDVVIWRALLGGCRLYKDVELAERVVSEMEAQDSGDYVLLSNLYASIGRWDDVEKVRKKMKDRGIKKIPGCSSIVIENIVHEFILGDKSHPRYAEICKKLEELGRKMASIGYLAETEVVFYDIDEEEKEQALGHHSEKLAIGLGLISMADGTTIRIVKNLRVCNDCHTATKLISKICRREIVVRDRIRFHHFKDGECSCKDYW